MTDGTKVIFEKTDMDGDLVRVEYNDGLISFTSNDNRSFVMVAEDAPWVIGCLDIIIQRGKETAS